tara:strand:+ start:2200 stop:4176 length:1977 start_codon:yes stop_codon:yes gene_type:complete
MLINLSSSNTRTGGQNAYDFTNDFDEPIEFKRNASIRVLKIWLNRKETYVVDSSNRKFKVGFGDPSVAKNVGYITEGTYTPQGLATALQDAFNKIGFQSGYKFNVSYQELKTDEHSYFIEWLYRSPVKPTARPSGSNVATNFTYTPNDGKLTGSADALAKVWRSDTQLALENLPSSARDGAGWSFTKFANNVGIIVGLTGKDPVSGTDTSIPYQIVFGGTGATDLTTGTFIIREDNNGVNQTITYGETAYNSLDKFRLMIANDSDKVIYQRNIYHLATTSYGGWNAIVVNVNLQQDINKFSEWNCGAMTSANIGTLTTTTLQDIEGSTTSSINQDTAGRATQTNPSTTMTTTATGVVDGCVCLVAGPLSVNGATFSDATSIIVAGASGSFSGVMKGTLTMTGDITFGIQSVAGTKTTNLMDYSFFHNAATSKLEARVNGVLVGTAVDDANVDYDDDLTLQREIQGSKSVMTWWYKDTAGVVDLLHTEGGVFTTGYLSVGARVVGEGVEGLKVGSTINSAGIGSDLTFYPEDIGDMIGYANNSYYSPKSVSELKSDAEPNETTGRNPNVIVSLTNLPIKSYQGHDGKVNKMVQSVNRNKGGGQSEIAILNPVKIPLHNAEPLVFNQLNITLTNNDGTFATDFIDTTNILLQVSGLEGTA